MIFVVIFLGSFIISCPIVFDSRDGAAGDGDVFLRHDFFFTIEISSSWGNTDLGRSPIRCTGLLAQSWAGSGAQAGRAGTGLPEYC